MFHHSHRQRVVTAVVGVALGSLAPAAPVVGVPAEPHSAHERSARLSHHPVTTRLVDTQVVGGTLRGGRTVPQVNVLVPHGYDRHPHRRYPVLYLLHGADGGYDDYERELGISTLFADFPGLVVMPDAGTYGNYTDWWNGGHRGSPRWETYLLNRVRGWVHHHYRIREGRRWHAVAGLSGGGQGAWRLGSDLPGYFGSIMTMSGAMPDMQETTTYAEFGPVMTQKAGQLVTYEDVFGPLSGFNATATNPITKMNHLVSSRLYVTYGDGNNCPADPVNPASIAVDIATEASLAQQNVRYVDELEALGIDVTDRPTCGVHTWPVWGRALADAKDNWGFFGRVPRPPRRWTFTSALPRGNAWDVRFVRRAQPADALVLHRVRNRVVTAEGSGVVRLRVGDCPTKLRLPGRWRIPRRCL